MLTLKFVMSAVGKIDVASQKSSSAISRFESKQEAEEMIFEENKQRCDFFKHYRFDDTEKVGDVSLYQILVNIIISSHMRNHVSAPSQDVVLLNFSNELDNLKVRTNS